MMEKLPKTTENCNSPAPGSVKLFAQALSLSGVLGRRALLIALLLLVNGPAFADGKLSGYIKNYTSVQDAVNHDLLTLDRLYANQLSSRIMFDYFLHRTAFQVHYETGLTIASNVASAPNSFGAGNEINGYRITDLDRTIGQASGKRTFSQNLDRFNVQWQFDSGDLTIGRQAVTLGSARIINPTDIFLPFNVQTLNTEYRRGVDGIRFQKPVGRLSELDMGIVLGKSGKTENSALFIQLQNHIKDKDVQFTAIRFSKQNLIGLGIQSVIGDFGFWFEAAHVYIDVFDGLLEGENYFRLSSGIDYAFNSTTTALLEYHYNGAGTRQSREYLTENQVAYVSGGVFLLGKNYLIPAVTWQVSPLLSLSLQAIVNMDETSLFIDLSTDYSLSDKVFLGVHLHLFTGRQPQTENGRAYPASEYGASPGRLTADLRYYF